MRFENQSVYYQTVKAVFALTLIICTVGFALEKPQKINLVTDNFSDAKYKEHIEQLKKKLPNKEFVIIIQPPFVVVGDEPEATVKQRSEKTVKWAVDKLKASYFTKDPNEILDIWLFKNEISYYKNAKEIFGDEPDTPYGYYSSAHKALVMNIGTGGGTLVHEIVHPFIEANFPDCPAWFNEGLASLYEQSGEVNGKIHGFTNWRLAGLQKAIRNKTNPTFKTLLATTNREFYDDETGVYYAQARYLCYYLQQKNLLVKFYQEFTKNSAKDPSGFKTLQTVLGERDMTKFQKNWETFVLQLRYGQ